MGIKSLKTLKTPNLAEAHSLKDIITERVIVDGEWCQYTTSSRRDIPEDIKHYIRKKAKEKIDPVLIQHLKIQNALFKIYTTNETYSSYEFIVNVFDASMPQSVRWVKSRGEKSKVEYGVYCTSFEASIILDSKSY